jgi:hypothetical protein
MSKKEFQHYKIGGIGNYYGGLHIMEHDGRYFWLIENYDTEFSDLSNWTEINKELYDSLIRSFPLSDQ